MRTPNWSTDNLPIPAPCTEDWDGMDGNDRRRHCARCNKHVHDLSALTRREADALLRGPGGTELCVRYAHDEAGALAFRPEPLLPAFMILPARRIALGLGLAAGVAAVGGAVVHTQGAIAPQQALGQLAPVIRPTPIPIPPPPPAPDAAEPAPPQREDEHVRRTEPQRRRAPAPPPRTAPPAERKLMGKPMMPRHPLD